MALSFPNACRSYEARHNRILFWGHDLTREVSFFVDGAALTKLDPRANATESEMLDTFDRALDRIHDAARRAYARVRQSVHVLVAEDF